MGNLLGPGLMAGNQTTTLANGVHTIAWGVVDSAGHASGVGSRYFTVANPTGVAAKPLTSAGDPVGALSGAKSTGITATIADTAGLSELPPFGVIESPVEDVVAAGRMVVSGWALHLTEVDPTIELLVDGEPVSVDTVHAARPDVCAVYSFLSHCLESQPGFALTWDTSADSEGVHTIAVRLRDSVGNVAVVGGRTVTVRNR